MVRSVPPRTKNVTHIDNGNCENVQLNDSLNLVFFSVTKNASTALQQWCKGTTINYSILDSSYKNNLIKFWVIRNPIDRLVSAYFTIKKLYGDITVGYIESILAYKNKMTQEEILTNLSWSNEISSLEENFEKFIDSLENNNFYDGHLWPQFLALQDNKVTINEVDTLLFENLKYDLIALCKKYNISKDPSLPLRNETVGPGKLKLQEFVNSNQSIQKKIIKIYNKDWEMYNTISNNR